MTDYNNFAQTFTRSRDNMKWEEIDYFISSPHLTSPKGRGIKGMKILDIWCGSGRLLQQFSNHFDTNEIEYLWLDLSNEILNEAKKNYPEKEFLNLDMNGLEILENRKFDSIFFIASFHHLKTIAERIEVLEKAKKLLNKDWKIFLTNWSLESEFNKNKYEKSMIDNSENQFWSFDYSIKIGDYMRYYHGFSYNELKYLFDKAWFESLENREFENQKNFISIIKKASR